MLIFAILTVFIAVLMSGRTSEYLGKSSWLVRQFPASPSRPRVRWPRGSAAGTAGVDQQELRADAH
ncbi:MAG: potassium-transporting ATPase subunit KdpA [Proteobacteria bacterium]|nr:potassium-transporting ATPase subunit KdpA [Pseudomonadota bacterium]